jgi:hypothetical protein
MMTKSFCALAIALFSATALAQPAAETKDIEYRRFVDAFHLKDFIDNKSDLNSIIRFQYVLQPDNKALSYRDVTFTIDGTDYRPDRYWGLDLPVSGELYERDPTITRTSSLPVKFNLGMMVLVVGAAGPAVDSTLLRKARDHYDDLIAHAGFTVRNFAPSMKVAVVRGEATDGRCHIDGVESEDQAKPFGASGEVKFPLKQALAREAKGIVCSTPISEVLLDDE